MRTKSVNQYCRVRYSFNSSEFPIQLLSVEFQNFKRKTFTSFAVIAFVVNFLWLSLNCIVFKFQRQ